MEPKMLVGTMRLSTPTKSPLAVPAASVGESPNWAPSPGRMTLTRTWPTKIASRLVSM